MSVAVFMTLISVSIMPIGMPMAVLVIFAVPVALVIMPAVGVTVVVRVAPVSSWIGWLFITSGNPAVMMSLRCPETRDPHHLWRWWRGVAAVHREREAERFQSIWKPDPTPEERAPGKEEARKYVSYLSPTDVLCCGEVIL